MKNEEMRKSHLSDCRMATRYAVRRNTAILSTRIPNALY